MNPGESISAAIDDLRKRVEALEKKQPETAPESKPEGSDVRDQKEG